ncbi:MAG: hypothetical protein KAR08_11350, partial [Candidatus Heimdallarchaeota archaeon]|nr:hypothetical protein [Candidatus Heimdallarchaeota archaeon]
VFMTFMFMTAVQTQGFKLPSRLSNILAGIIVIPAAFFIPLSPPWTGIAGLWVAGGASYAFMIQGFLTMLMWITILHRHLSGIVHAFTGKEWSFSALEGQKISDNFETKKESVEKE